MAAAAASLRQASSRLAALRNVFFDLQCDPIVTLSTCGAGPSSLGVRNSSGEAARPRFPSCKYRCRSASLLSSVPDGDQKSTVILTLCLPGPILEHKKGCFSSVNCNFWWEILAFELRGEITQIEGQNSCRNGGHHNILFTNFFCHTFAHKIVNKWLPFQAALEAPSEMQLMLK